MNNEDLDRQLYRYPGSDVLRNKLDVRDAAVLDKAERRLVAIRAREGAPQGDFDLTHLRAIHRHLFQDLYDWAGELRRVDIAKGGHWFMPKDRIEAAMGDIHRRLVQQNRLKELSADAFADRAGVILGDVNYLHPFREGNGRTQTQYLKQLAAQAGWPIDLRKMKRETWMEASRQAHDGGYQPMAACIRAMLKEPRVPET
jgi:cell filamentation protein